MEDRRIDFTRGISAVVDPRLEGPGYAVILDNVDLTGIAAQAMRAPVFRLDPPAGTRDIFEYRGKWHFSPGRREWIADFVGRQERLFYKNVEVGTADRRPYKVIDGVEALLGTPRPIVPLYATPAVTLTPQNIEATASVGGGLVAGSKTYRLGLRTDLGLLPTSAPVSLAVAASGKVTLTWAAIKYTKATKIVVYGRDSAAEQILEELNPIVTSWVDDGSLTPNGQYAKTLDENNLFYYFFTYLRTVNGHEDESGPSPVFGPMVTAKARQITRYPLFEGILDGGWTYTSGQLHTNPTSRDNAINGYLRRAMDSRIYLTTRTAHGRSAGDMIGVLHAHSGVSTTIPRQIYSSAVPAVALAKPTLTALIEEALPGGAIAWGAGVLHRVGVTAFRGASWENCLGGPPAETEALIGDTLTLTPTGGKAMTVRWAFPSGDVDGFHVYLDGFWIATVPSTIQFCTFGQVAPHGGRPLPIINTTITRVLILPKTASIDWDPGVSVSAGKWGDISYTPKTQVVPIAGSYVPANGDLIWFSSDVALVTGFSAICGVTQGSSAFFLPLLTEDTITITGAQICKIAGPHMRFVTKWNLYVTRGDTGAFLLQGTYDLDQVDVVDASPVEALGSTCGSNYDVSGLDGVALTVEFQPPPQDLHGLTPHNNSLFGIVDRTVRWTPINRPDAWPDVYSRDFESEPLALYPYGGTLLVLCSDGIRRMDGDDPSAMRCQKTLAEDGLMAPYSVQPTPAGLVYLSKRGLMAFRADLNDAVPISEGRIDPAFFLSGSGDPEGAPFPFWMIPTRRGAAWAHLTKGLPAADPARIERELSDVLPIGWATRCIRSFVWRGRYHLYYGDFTGQSNSFKHHGMVIVDCTQRTYPITVSGLKPMAAHVTETQRAYLLFQDPVTSPPG